jgi:ferric-dicitrate binding protein FerR (iron transport regulator)
MAYKEDRFIKTTLLKGNVKVETRGHTRSLHPGQQYVQYLSGEDRLVPSADTVEAVAWKNGWFIFKGQPLPDVMNQLCRWYDAHVEYANADTPNVSVITQGSRKDPASAVLKRIEASGGVHFEIDDNRRITVSSR